MLKEFREFAVRGNAVDLAVGLIIGAAFGAIVNSLVEDIFMPVLGLIMGKVDFSQLFFVLRQGDPAGPYTTVDAAVKAGAVTLNYGVFINAIVSFIVVAFAMFMLVKAMNKLNRAEEAAAETKNCPHCLTAVPIDATRCPACTSELNA
ncbi:MAG: large-conductance mechanosensitive channel protein MscL [Coriobacteriia bacterium]|jgi:large conductance mechanosensitive channel|nr:large-conductance mechanosensitive channel protein MscL [Coriobacteriia bacterium]